VVTDERDGAFDSAFPTTLNPGATATRTFTSTITFADATAGNVNNTVSVTANALQVAVSDETTAECSLTPVEGIVITKSCPVLTTGQRIGSTITYTVTIENTGDTTLTGIDVTDSRAGSFDTPFPTELAPGASATRTFTSTITSDDATMGNVDNTVTVTTDDETIFGSATAECPLTPGTVIIHKTGNLGAEMLPEVCFELRQGEAVVGPVCTDENGLATFTNVPLGTYTVAEASTPPGYVPVAPFEVTVSQAETVTLTIDNPRGSIGLPIFKLDCQTDPGEVLASDLFADVNYVPDGCVRVAGVAFTVTIDDEAQTGSFVTGADGSFTLTAPFFSSVEVTEDVTTATPGYLPREATQSIDSVPVEGAEGLVFVNLAQDGNVKIIKMVCKTKKARATTFEITEPDSVTVAGGKDEHNDTCWRGANVAFTITGGNLTQPLKVKTDRNGEINIGLQAGDYTIVEDVTGATAEFTVVANQTTVIKVTNFKVVEKPQPTPTPTKPGKPTPIEELPNTGSGASGLGGGFGWLSLLILSLGGLASVSLLAIGAKRQKRTRRGA